MNKVRGGTPVHDGPSLCRTCRNVTVVVGRSLGEEFINCGTLDRRITFHVTECSSFDDATRPSLGSMQQIAWELCTDKGGRKIGFLSPRDYRKRREELEDIDYLNEPEVIRSHK